VADSLLEGSGFELPVPRWGSSPASIKAALAHCVGQDGGVKTDAFLNDPRDRHFDPAAVQSYRDGIPAPALSSAQVRAARKIYSKGGHAKRLPVLAEPQTV
jgi:hypothetical protein